MAVGARPGVGALVAAVLLPPLGIFLVRGLSPAFWIGTLLTLVGWVPGVVFALVTVLQPRFLART